MASKLSDLSGVGPKTKSELNDNGIHTVEDVVDVDIETLASCGMSESRAREIKNEAQRSTVIIQTGNEVRDEYNSKEKVPSGIKQLDDAIEGGFEEEALVSIWGLAETGKTQLANKVMVQGIEETNKDAIYIETEKNRFRPQRIEALSSLDDILDRIHRVKAYSLDQQYNSYFKVMEAFNAEDVSIIVVDSLVARFRLEEDFQGRGTFSSRSEEMGKHLVAMERLGEELACPILFTNQAYQNPDQYGKNVLQYGGAKIKHTATFYIHMSKGKGDLHNAEVQKHPSTGNTDVVINITEDDVKAVE